MLDKKCHQKRNYSVAMDIASAMKVEIVKKHWTHMDEYVGIQRDQGLAQLSKYNIFLLYQAYVCPSQDATIFQCPSQQLD